MGLHLREMGAADGRRVLFLHPGNATGASWADVVADLPGVRGLCPDLPGFGKSGAIPLEDFACSADHVAALLRAQPDAAPLPVVGYSLGGYTGLMLAARHPDLVSRALLTGFQVVPVSGRWWLGPLSVAISPLMTRSFFRRRAFAALGLSGNTSWSPGPRSPCDARTLRRIADLAFSFEARDEIERIAVPLTVLAGRQEMRDIRDTVKLITETAENARGGFALGGHGWPAVSHDLFVATVRAWLDDAPLPAGIEPV
ncbi:alpha/beta fold hydrolase [Jannaschia sp. KMU-145]|uniref:alpha/beta fold hydrolase n=1 Tax=Jannaschia halovivens TaxID=3388667 RepID=UPI00396B0A51